jgi:hypothetical protein
MTEEHPEGYEPPKAEDLDTDHGPAVTAAGELRSPVGDTG